MRRFASIVALFLLLSAAAPVLACMTGSAAMSHEESACCRAMHGHCGEMANMGCCRVQVRHDLPQLTTQATALSTQWFVVSLLEPVTLPPQSAAATFWNLPDEYPPPGLVAAETTVLRI